MPFYAKDSKGNRVSIDTAEKGKNYYCQTCGQKMFPKKKGVERAPHFAHYSPRGTSGYTPCNDNWKYDMSEWHRGWQNRFPADCQERVVSIGAKRHIADVLLNDIVIEFQHSSSISFAEFNDRNDFYTQAGYNVLWVFDVSEEFKNDDITVGDKYNEYNWDSPWTMFKKLNIPCQKDVTIYFQLESLDEEYPLEKVVHSYSNFKKFYTDIGHSLSVDSFVDMVNSKDEKLYYKSYKPEEIIHTVEGGKSIFELWQDNYTGIMVQNLVNNKVMAINGNKGYINLENRGHGSDKVIGYYARRNPLTGRFDVNKNKKYIVWQAEDSIWKMLHHFEASKEKVDEWKKEREELKQKIIKEEEELRRQREARFNYYEEQLNYIKKEQQTSNSFYKQNHNQTESSITQSEKPKMILKQTKSVNESLDELQWKIFRSDLERLLKLPYPVFDPSGKQWLKCSCCGVKDTIDSFVGRANSKNIGLCKNCIVKNAVNEALKKNRRFSYLFYGDEMKNVVCKPILQFPGISTLLELFVVLEKCWSKETAFPFFQKDWVESNPSYGQCDITATLVHDMFGASIHKIQCNGGITHYFNKINGQYIDLTREQFDFYNIPVNYEPNQDISRDYCEKDPNTYARYRLLQRRIMNYLNPAKGNLKGEIKNEKRR